jgi:hypothetical protein
MRSLIVSVTDCGGSGKGGGVEDRDESYAESCREAASPSSTVLTEGEGGMAICRWGRRCRTIQSKLGEVGGPRGLVGW